MACRLILFILLAATPALAQMEPGRELELGGGWFQFDPLDIGDLGGRWGGPSIDLAWTSWWSERAGIAVGVTSVLRSLEPAGALPPLFYGHVTLRRRWVDADGRGFLHVGVGGGPVLALHNRYVKAWDAERETTYHTGETKRELGLGYLWHVELMVTRSLRDGLNLRVGVTTTPLLYIPLTVQPVAMAVWKF